MSSMDDANHPGLALAQRRPTALLLVVLAHLAVLAAVVWQGQRPRKHIVLHQQQAPVTVFIAAAVQTSQHPPSDLRHDEAMRPPQMKLPQIALVEPPEIVVSTSATQDAVRQPEVPPPQPPTAAVEAAAPAATLAPKQASLTTAPVAGADRQPTDVRKTWESEVSSLLQRNKRYPPAALWMRAEDTVLLRVELGRDGRVRNARVVRSHRVLPLDREALDLVARLGVLPPPPREVDGDPVVLTIPIDFYLQ